MKALILAAGLGTRLRPLTEKIPKPLLPIGHKPLLFIQLENLAKHRVFNILINTHYLPEKIETFVSENSFESLNTLVSLTHEKELLGSAGTLKENKFFFEDQEHFFIVYGDVFTNINYTKLLQKHKETDALVTIAVYREEHPETKGVVIFSDSGRITSFVEKPTCGIDGVAYANAGFYVVNKKIMNFLNNFNSVPLDFGKDLFPYLLQQNQKMVAYIMGDDEFLLDIGTIESYDEASKMLNQFR